MNKSLLKARLRFKYWRMQKYYNRIEWIVGLTGMMSGRNGEEVEKECIIDTRMKFNEPGWRPFFYYKESWKKSFGGPWKD